MFIVSLSAFYSNWIRMYSCQMKVGDADKKWFMQEHLIDLCAIHRISLKIWPIRQAFAFFWGVAFVLILQVKDCTISHSHVQINKVNVWLCIFFFSLVVNARLHWHLVPVKVHLLRVINDIRIGTKTILATSVQKFKLKKCLGTSMQSET